MAEECAVFGCTNKRSQGLFVGDFCAPCDSGLRTGLIGHGTSFVHKLVDRRERLESALNASRGQWIHGSTRSVACSRWDWKQSGERFRLGAQLDESAIWPQLAMTLHRRIIRNMTNKTDPLPTETSKHTPGPWSCFFKHKYNEWHVGVPLSSGTMKLALFPDGCPTDNPEADCHLIAAAPDLLEGLKRAASELERYVDLQLNLEYIEYAADTQKKLDAVNAIVAKAEGRS